MNRVKFFGEAYTHDSETVRSVVAEWVGKPDLAVRIKVLGDQVIYEDDTAYVYGEIGVTSGQEDCLLQGHLAAKLDEAKQRLQRLVDLFKARSVEAYLDCT